MKRLIFAALVACSPSAPKTVTVSAPPASATATVTATATATAPVTASAPACIVVNQNDLSGTATTLQGTVECGKHSHPNGTMFDFCVLELEPPRCVKGLEKDVTVDEVQLAGETDFRKLQKQRIRVHGDPFPQHTAWHVRAVVVTVKSFERL